MDAEALIAYQMDRLRDDRRIAMRQVREAIEKARHELDHIEQQIEHADAGLPYLRVGQVDGVSAQSVFNAFGVIERMASFEAFARQAMKVEKRAEQIAAENGIDLDEARERAQFEAEHGILIYGG